VQRTSSNGNYLQLARVFAFFFGLREEKREEVKAQALGMDLVMICCSLL
jgi:hypothetical protein